MREISSLLTFSTFEGGNVLRSTSTPSMNETFSTVPDPDFPVGLHCYRQKRLTVSTRDTPRTPMPTKILCIDFGGSREPWGTYLQYGVAAIAHQCIDVTSRWTRWELSILTCPYDFEDSWVCCRLTSFRLTFYRVCCQLTFVQLAFVHHSSDDLQWLRGIGHTSRLTLGTP